MAPVGSMPISDRRAIRYVFTDIDDTLTKEGRLLESAYAALWRLRERGIRVIPVTGRPAGWCDLIARQWPVDAVVGENGALVFYLDDGRLKQFFHPDVAGDDVRHKLETVRDEVFRRVPGTRPATDQFCRMFDLAIDFREEPPYLSYETARVIRDICVESGATAKISSIHVNAWFGSYDKLSMVKLYMREKRGIDLDIDQSAAFFCGDSPNDEPMFRFFRNSCAVANIREFGAIVEWPPRYVTETSFGDGFSEAVAVLLT